MFFGGARKTRRKTRRHRRHKRGYHTRTGYKVRAFKTGKFAVGKKHTKSKSHKRRQNFVTGARMKFFNRRGHWQKHAQGKKTKRRPYSKRR